MKLERAFYLHTAPRVWRGRREGSCFFAYFGFSFAMKEKKRGLFWVGGRSFVLLLFNANEKEEKSQGGCSRQVWIFHHLCKQEREKIKVWWKSQERLNCSGSKAGVQGDPEAVDVGSKQGRGWVPELRAPHGFCPPSVCALSKGCSLSAAANSSAAVWGEPSCTSL